MKHTFNLEHMTMDDYMAVMRAAADYDLIALLEIANRFYAGDATSLPFAELNPLLAQFGAALKASIEETNTPDASRLLAQVFKQEPPQ